MNGSPATNSRNKEEINCQAAEEQAHLGCRTVSQKENNVHLNGGLGGFVAVTALYKPFDQSLKACRVNDIGREMAGKEVGGSCYAMPLSLKGWMEREETVRQREMENSRIDAEENATKQ